MKYYLKLDLDWAESSLELQSYFYNFISLDSVNGCTHMNTSHVLQYCPSITKMVSKLNSTIDYISLIVYKYQSQGDIHIDADKKNIVRILMPVLNCEYSKTNFYKTKTPPKSTFSSHGVEYHKFPVNECELVDSVSIGDGPILFRVKEPHGVTISDNALYPRVSCTIGLKEDLGYLLD